MKYITGLIDIDRFLMYANIPSHTLPGGGTGGKDGYFQLTVLLETNIKNANAQKMIKYEHFITDKTTRDVSVHTFEIGYRI